MSFTIITKRAPSWNSLLLLPLIVLLISGMAFGQEVTSGIYGKVTDAQGLGVPGATVTITSPDHITTEVRVTTSGGTYRVQRLVASDNYTIVVELAGFGTVTYEEVAVRAGQQIAVDVTLQPAAVQESVTVIGESPLVDVKSSTSMRTLERARLENIPMGRGYQHLLTSMAGVLDSEYVFAPAQSVLGSDPRGNLYNIDGAVANDTTVGYILTEIPIDMIEEVQVTTAGQTAEFGMSHGGVFNFVTKSGGNDFSGSLYLFYQGEGTEGDNMTTELSEQIGKGSSVVKDQDVGFTFGGPIMRDKLWFFANARRLEKELSQPILPNQAFNTNQIHTFLKLTSQLAPATRWSGSLTTRNQDKYPSNVTGYQNADAKETWQQQNRIQKIINTNLTHLFGDDTILDLKYNRQWKKFEHLAPNNPDNKIGWTDAVTGLQFGGITSSLYTMWCRCTWGAGFNLSHFRETDNSSHEFKGGVFLDKPNADRQFAYPPGTDYRQYLADGVPFRVVLEWYPIESQAGAVDRIAAFIQDQWTIGDSLTLNIGARYTASEGWLPEQARGGGAWFPRVVYPETHGLIDFSHIAPRIGVVYAMGEEKRTSVKAYYGRHYKALLTQDLSNMSPTSGGSEQYTWNDTNGDGQFQDGEQGTLLGSQLNPVFGDRSDLVEDDLTNSYVDAFHFTLEHELNRDMVVSASAVIKRERNLMENYTVRETGDQANPFADYSPITVVNQHTKQDMTVYALRREFQGKRSKNILGNPSFADELYRDYEGVEFTARRRFRDGWQLMASYNLSNTTGNIANDFAATTTYNNMYNNPNTLINAEGKLAKDATHAFKLQGTYTFPADIIVSGFYQFVTGFPIHLIESFGSDLAQGAYTSRYFPLCPGASAGSKGHGGGGGGCKAAPLGNSAIWSGTIDVASMPRGTLRHDNRSKLDLRVEKKFAFGDGKAVGIIADIFNVTNINRVTSFKGLKMDQTANFLVPASIELPRVLRIGLRFTF